jgi:Na+/melibiose symporter-like transporter
MESARFKGGKYIPWIRITQFTMYAGLVLQFLPFNIPLAVRAGTLIVGYLAYNASTTINTTSQYGILSMISGPSINNRNKVSILATRVTTVASVITAVSAAPLRNFIADSLGENQRYKYFIMAAGFGLLLFASSSIMRSIAKPYDGPHIYENSGPPRPKVTVKDMIRCVVTNNQLIVYIVSTVLYFIGMMSPMGLTMYYYIYIQNDPRLIMMTVATTVTRLFSLVTTMVGPKLGLKLGRKKARAVGQVGSFLGSVGIILFGHINVYVYIAFTCFNAMSAALYQGFAVSYIIDVGEYGFWKSGIDNRTVTTSLISIPTKIASFVGGSLGLYGLAAIGWTQGMTVDTAFTRKFMLLLGGIPAVCYLLACMMTTFLYKIDDKEAQLYARENAERVAANKA